MSLVVWLPLTKDLRQQGLSTTTYTQNSGTAISSGGKLGSCLTATSNATVIVNLPTLATMLANGKTYSLACWVKITNNVTDGWVIKLGTNSCGLWWAASIARWVWNENDNGKRCANPTISGNANWHHLVTTVDKTVSGMITAKHYVDGVPAESYEMQTWDCSNHSQPAGTTITINPYVAQLNDIRLYDHCLSPMEVKELAKGLVLHYPLNRNGWGQENLLSGNNAKITTWTNYMPDSVILSGDGYDNKYTLIKGIGGWEKIFTDAITVTSGKTYTLSFDYSVEQNYTGYSGQFGLSVCTTSQAKYGADTDVITKVNFGTVQKSKSRTSVTFTATSNTIYLVANGGNINDGQENISFYISYIKLEEGSTATPWCPNSSDALATTMSLNSTTEYDCSGFCNNGTRTGTFSWSSDTPKYSVSTQFNGTQYVQAPFSCGTISEAVSVAVWGYESNWNTSSAERLIGAATNGSGWCIGDYGSENTLFAFYANGSYNTATGFKQLSVGWHHFVITFDGLHLNYYVDGQLFSSKTFSTKQIATGNYNIEIGRHYGDGCNFKGCMSDVRIYATALSADDVKSLYQNSAYIDSSGNIYGAVHSEV